MKEKCNGCVCIGCVHECKETRCAKCDKARKNSGAIHCFQKVEGTTTNTNNEEVVAMTRKEQIEQLNDRLGRAIQEKVFQVQEARELKVIYVGVCGYAKEGEAYSDGVHLAGSKYHPLLATSLEGEDKGGIQVLWDWVKSQLANNFEIPEDITLEEIEETWIIDDNAAADMLEGFVYEFGIDPNDPVIEDKPKVRHTVWINGEDTGKTQAEIWLEMIEDPNIEETFKDELRSLLVIHGVPMDNKEEIMRKVGMELLIVDGKEWKINKEEVQSFLHHADLFGHRVENWFLCDTCDTWYPKTEIGSCEEGILCKECNNRLEEYLATPEQVPAAWACPECGVRDMEVLDPMSGAGIIHCTLCDILYDSDNGYVIVRDIYDQDSAELIEEQYLDDKREGRI